MQDSAKADACQVLLIGRICRVDFNESARAIPKIAFLTLFSLAVVYSLSG
jgi:hypothetical protein